MIGAGISSLSRARTRQPWNAGSLRRAWESNIRRHAGAQFTFAVIEANFDAEDLLHSLPDRLHVARGEFRIPRDLFDGSGKIPARIGIDAHLDGLGELQMAQPGFGDIHADPGVLRQ